MRNFALYVPTAQGPINFLTADIAVSGETFGVGVQAETIRFTTADITLGTEAFELVVTGVFPRSCFFIF